MIRTVTLLAGALQTLLLTKANALARATGLVQRQRCWSGAGWVPTLVFGWMEQPHATLEDLTDRAAQRGARRTPQGWDQWFGPPAADCLKRLAHEAVGTLLHTEAAAIPLLQRFTRVTVEDCTAVALPPRLATAYAGCGGNDPPQRDQAALKLYVRLELTVGQVTDLAFRPGRHAAVTAAQQAPPLPAGSLRLKDLGFFDLDLLAQDSQAGVHWISRWPSHVTLRCGAQPAEALAAFWQRQTGDALDQPVTLGQQQQLSGRLLAVRCPAAMREKRWRRLQERAREQGRRVSDAQRVLAGWTLLLTNVPAARLTFDEAWVLYRARWQIELLFKLWKSQGPRANARGHRGDRVLCEVLAKLLAQLVQHGLLLPAHPWLDGKAATRQVRRLRRLIAELVEALHSRKTLAVVWEKIPEHRRRLRPRNRRKKKPSTIELLNDPGRARLGLT